MVVVSTRKGFAVVADEVSKLAENSREAAKEIVNLVNDSVKKTKTGNELANKGEEILRDILDKATQNAVFIQEISDISASQNEEMNNMERMVGHINVATKEQAVGIEQINSSILAMSNSTQANAEYSVKGAQSAHELTAQSNRLQDVVSDISQHVSSRSDKNTYRIPAQAEALQAPGVVINL